ncbi:hypothetical protein R1sor_015700 [Riccia sorocarpa]|uniref:Non-homologous end-joining factor 1 n=1 Tax=Riccia sorocarpa TaxID=122646 RepID=A0ABD3HEX6_9MARC
MATKHTRLYFDDLTARLKTKFSISHVWFVTLNVTDASLVIWKHAELDPVKCGNLLQCISNTKSVLEVLAMKDGGTFVRLTLEPKNMDRQTSKTALDGDLLSARDSQAYNNLLDICASMRFMDVPASMHLMDVLASMNLMDALTSMNLMDFKASYVRLDEPTSMSLMDLSVVINNVLRKQSGYKLVECECIKRALSSGVFGVLQREAASYLPHPELASAAAPRKPVTATAESDSEEEREIARDIKASRRHEAERMAEAKAAKSSKPSKDKGKNVVLETQKKKPSVPSQAPREKLLGSSFSAAAAETARISRESKMDSLKRKRVSQVMPPPQAKVPVRVADETSEEEENIATDKEESEESDSGSESPLPSQPVNKKEAFDSLASPHRRNQA